MSLSPGGRSTMQLLLIICRNSLENKVLELLKGVGVGCQHYTIIEKVHGAGHSGVVPCEWIGPNTVILVALCDRDARAVAEVIKDFASMYTMRLGGEDIPLKLFSWRCDVLI